jgi:hypothetical protein
MPAIPIISPGVNITASGAIVVQNKLLISNRGVNEGTIAVPNYLSPNWGGVPGTWSNGIGTQDPAKGWVEGRESEMTLPSFTLPTINMTMFVSPYYKRQIEVPAPALAETVYYPPQTTLAFCLVTVIPGNEDNAEGSIPLTAPIFLPVGVPVFYSARLPLTQVGVRIFNQAAPQPSEDLRTYTEICYILAVSQ